MNLAAASLRRPITVLVALVAITLGAILAIRQMPRDIFPDLGIPVIYVAQPYGGLDPKQMEGFIVNYYEYHFLYISGIEHVESKSIQGTGLIKLQFHPGTDMAQALSETIGYVNRARAFMPTGTVPPFVVRFDAGGVPVGDLVFTSEHRSVGELQDLALFRVRPMFATLPGVSAPPPFGAAQRSIVIRLDPERLHAYNMPPDEVVAALTSANTITPAGNVPIGDAWPMVPTNGVVSNIQDLSALPLRHDVFLRDVGTVEDSSDLTTGYALVNGKRTVYIPVTKRADASTLAVVEQVKKNLLRFQSVLPDDVKVTYQFDQSPYVTGSIDGLVLEGVLGALLTGLMVLLFLRDLRSVALVVVNIPLSVLAALLLLWLSRQTLNMMTLGGLALAVGILVDEATVAVENIHTHLGQGKSPARAAQDGITETSVPRFLSMLCILAVFIPSFFMSGTTRALFVPLSLAVGFAMVASYLLSSSFVPVLAALILKPHHTSWHAGERYAGLLRPLVQRRSLVLAYLLACGLLIVLGTGSLGTEIFPAVDAGQLQLRLKAASGTRIDRTEAIALQTLDAIKQEAGPDNVLISLGFVGVQPPSYPINSIYLWTSGPEEAVMQVALRNVAIEPFKERLRSRLAQALPDVRFSFEPADIVSRVMSFGSFTPIEVDVSGPKLDASRTFATKLLESLHRVPSLRDLQMVQNFDYPTVQLTVDRERAGLMGVTEADVSRSIVTATSSSRFVVPNFWADPKSGVGYQVQVEVPSEAMHSLDDLANVPVARGVLLRNVAEVHPGQTVGEYDRYNMQRMVTLSANLAGEDLGHAAAEVRDAIRAAGAPPPRVSVAVRGQVVPLEEMFDGLRGGVALAIVAVFLLLAANFQSWRLSLAIVAILPAVLAGVACGLLVTGTTLNVQSFMGTIMAVGVAVANAILLVTFAERKRREGATPWEAAIDGASTRLRPILMTSCAMIAGMLPMALGLGSGGQQTAPLGRAVIGGLLGGSLATLLILPAIFAWLQHGQSIRSVSLEATE